MPVWFKNLVLFRLIEPFGMSPEQVGEALIDDAFRPCGGLDPFSYGWESPLGRLGTELVHAANGCILLCARREERILPPAVVREAVEEKVADIEEKEFRTVYRKERQRMARKSL